MAGDLCTAARIISLLPLSFATDVTDGASGLWLETWTGVGLGGLEITCSPRDPRFTSSNLVEVDGFFQDVKILSTSPPGGKLGVPSLRFQAR